ncbi:SRPBCC family protein [Mycolicibacterium sp.]|uniref:type II toxin-antitoxin system Rv0910 family toxin n=1 Tax=Mycolicibacterium sp. TaxID=2320850 RepID=UPI001A23536B|nr:SRPBCC family protein [Mycolicibacterium sp.]MBJ7339354.1 SRPBCC family protein [Mycolicibacterium sp.]
MAKVDVSVTSRLSPEKAWAMASDLERFDEWLTIFGGWRSPVPDVIEKGTEVSSLIKVKGFRNTIHWEVTNYEEPSRIEMCGKGFGGVQIALLTDIVDNQPGTTFHLVADLSGAVLNGPIGSLVARVIKGDVKRSVENLAKLG